MTVSAPSIDERKFVVALARGLDLLRAFRPGETLLGNRDFVERTGLPKATVNRLAYTLTVLGYLRFDESLGKYALDAGVLSLGFALLSGTDTLELARPHLRAFAREVGAAVSLGCRDGLDMVYLETIRSETALTLGLDPVDEPRFREQDFGAWTGRRHNDLTVELGAAYQAFWKSPAGNRPPGGESFVDQIDRARAGLACLPAGDAVLVVHSGTVRAVLAIALELAPDSALRFVIDPLSLTRIDRLENGWRVVAVNQRSKD